MTEIAMTEIATPNPAIADTPTDAVTSPTMLFLEPLSAAEADHVISVVRGAVAMAESDKSRSFLRLLISRHPRCAIGGPGTGSDSAQLEALRLSLMAVCLGGVSDTALRHLHALNRTLEKPTPWVSILEQARRGHTKRATMRLGLRSPDARALLPAVWRHEGVIGIVRALAQALGLKLQNPEIARHYTALAELPQESVGRAFFDHMRSRKLPLPGEKGGMFERALHHDMMHVVTGFDTDARGEGRLSAYYAGATSRHPVRGADAFTFIMVGLLTFELGFDIGPPFVGAHKAVIDPFELFTVFDIGRRVPINLLTDWNVRSSFVLPLAELRRSFGIPEGGALKRSA